MTAYLPCFFYEMNGFLLDIKPTDGKAWWPEVYKKQINGRNAPEKVQKSHGSNVNYVNVFVSSYNMRMNMHLAKLMKVLKF